MPTETTTAPSPSYTQLAAAFADAASPFLEGFLGDKGKAVDLVVHAALSFATALQAQRASGSITDLQAASDRAGAAIARLEVAVNAQATQGDVAAAALDANGAAVATTQRMGIPKQPDPGSSQ